MHESAGPARRANVVDRLKSELSWCSGELEVEREKRRELERANTDLRAELAVRPPSYQHFYELLIPFGPFILGTAALVDIVGSWSLGESPRYDLDAMFEGVGLLIASWALLHQFWPRHREAGSDVVFALLFGCVFAGVWVGFALLGIFL
jgi:hypothetical protein